MPRDPFIIRATSSGLLPRPDLLAVTDHLRNIGALGSGVTIAAGGTELPEKVIKALKGTAERFGIDIDGIPDIKLAERLMNRRFCGVSDSGNGGLGTTAYGSPGGRWTRGTLRFAIDTTGVMGLTAAQAINIIQGVFAQWQAAVPGFFNFVPAMGFPADIRVAFGGQSSDSRFGSPGGVVGVGGYPPNGQIFFDSAETWQAANLTAVALHEVGHVLGLSHSTRSGSVMYPFGPPAAVLDPETLAAIRGLYGSWTPQTRLSDRGSNDGPALAEAGTINFTSRYLNLYMAWKGIDGDSGLYWSRLDGGTWTPQQKIPGVGSSHGPALTTMNASVGGVPAYGLAMAWKGSPGDQGIYFSRSFDRDNWAAQEKVPNVGTSARPAIAEFGGSLWLAWKGAGNDQSIYVATFDGINWSAQSQVLGVGTSSGPSLAVVGGRLYMIWKGVEGDSRCYYTWRDNAANPIWQPQRVVAYVLAETQGMVSVPIGSSHGPSICAVGNSLYATWKGVNGDTGIYFSYFVDDEWQGQIKIADVGTSARPALATLDGRLFMLWKGIPGDSNLYYSAL